VRIRFVLPMVLSFTFAISAMEAEKVLCVVSSDIDSDIGKIVVQMDQDDRAIEHLYQDSYRDSKLTARIELKADDLRSGIVLNRKDKYITVRMHSDNFDPERGGVLFLDTLYSGISGERKEYEMQLAIDKTGPVLIQNKQNFSKMNFVAKRSKIFGVIGIEKVLFGN
jgi:hypothetical protein